MSVRPIVPVGLAFLLAAGLAVMPPATGPLAAPQAAAAAAPKTCAATPFRTNTAKKTVYRVPALVATTKGTLVAFAERRRSISPSADISDTEIVAARSPDHGCHWCSPKVIADQGNGTVGNPAPVLDTTTGTILLFSVLRPKGGTTTHGFHMQRSTDDGRTFSAYRSSAKDLTGVKGWPGGLAGPGHAIQLHAAKSSHRGRIVVPMGFKQGNRYGASAVISDDHGKTWRMGYKQTGTDGRIEGTVAELSDGRLWISYRNRNVSTPVGKGRIGAFSSDGGDSLSRSFRNAGLPTVSVQGSALALSGTYADALLFSSPTRKDVSRRQEMGIFVSRWSGMGTKWRRPVLVQSGTHPGAYSDLVQLSDSMIGILYETGKTSWKERIDFRSLRISGVVR